MVFLFGDVEGTAVLALVDTAAGFLVAPFQVLDMLEGSALTFMLGFSTV